MRPAPSIEKLENRLAADPASKVFVPLAEEYRKAGEIDRAVELLRSGLTKNTEYAAAEVALARALLQKDEREECRRILTRVTRRVPDNLLAEKLLSEAGGPLETEEPPADMEEAVSDQADETDQAAEEPVQDLASDQDYETDQAAEEPVQELASDQADETDQAAEEPVQELASDQADETDQAAEEPVQELASHQEDETGQAADDDRSAEVGNDTEEMTTPLPDGPLWSSPASAERAPEPATPEPGVWKSDEQSEEPTFDTVMISRADIEPRREAEPEAPDVPVGGPGGTEPVPGTGTERGPRARFGEPCEAGEGEPDDDEQAIQMADAEPEPEDEPYAFPVEDSGPDDDEQAVQMADAEPEPEPEDEPYSIEVEDSGPDDDEQAVQMADAEPEPEPEEEPHTIPGEDDEQAVQMADAEREPEPEDEPYSIEVEDSGPDDDEQAVQMADAEPEPEPGEEAPGWLATEVDDEPEYRDPDESVRLISLARLYRRQGDLDKAAGVYRDLLDTEPDNKLARRELGELCGDGLTEITDEDIIPSDARVEKAFQAASMETMADARRRKVAFLRSWLEHIRAQD